MQTLRGAVLLVIAVLVGVFLLREAPSEGTSVAAAKSSSTTAPRTTTTVATAAAPPTTAALRSPTQVSVLVLNGTHVSGAASRVNRQLIGAGYNSVGTGNATTSDNATTTVDYIAGYQAEAVALAASLSLPPTAAQPMPTPPPVSDTKGANLVVVVGTDLASQVSSGTPASQPPATSPPTTAAHTTTTVRHTTTTAAHTTTTVKR